MLNVTKNSFHIPTALFTFFNALLTSKQSFWLGQFENIKFKSELTDFLNLHTLTIGWANAKLHALDVLFE